MAVRFIVGRAGTGKTFRCIEAIRRRILQNPVEGPRLLLLVPEQAGLQMERALMAPSQTSETSESPYLAAHRVEVLSFRRLALRALDSTSKLDQRPLSETGRAMILRKLLGREFHRLQYYRRAAGFGGLFDRLNATIEELIEEDILPEGLDRVGTPDPAPDPTRDAKFHDLRIIYRAYLDFLGTHRLDPSGRLHAATPLLGICSWLESAELWVDGFASFSRLEADALLELARHCASVEITALLDPGLYEIPPESPRRGDAGILFAKVHQTCWDLRSRFSAAGLELDAPEILKPELPARFIRCPPLADLERRLFATPLRNVPPPRESASSFQSDIEWASLPTRRLEVEYATAKIVEWTRCSPPRFRYRDVAVIVRDLTPYHDLIASAFTARHIPYFLDQRRSLSHHPLIEFLRCFVLLVTEDFSLDATRLLLKTGLLPLTLTSADELENYLLAAGISGRSAWSQGDWTFVKNKPRRGQPPLTVELRTAQLAGVNQSRRIVLEALRPWLALTETPGMRNGLQWASAMRQTCGLSRKQSTQPGSVDASLPSLPLDFADNGSGALISQRMPPSERQRPVLNIPTTMLQWSTEAEAAGDLGTADEHRQVLREVDDFLEDLATALNDTTLSPRELEAVVESGLSRVSLGLTPPMVDQVLVGSIDRSRHPDIKAAILLGFNDGMYPMRRSEDSILNDDDRDRLIAAGIPLRPGTGRRALDERLMVYTALTRPAESLVVTSAAADEQGKALQPSPYLPDVLAALPQLTVRSIPDPNLSRSHWSVLTPRDLVAQLGLEIRTRPPIAQDDIEPRSLWNALYESTCTSPAFRRNEKDSIRAMERALCDVQTDCLSPPVLARLFPPNEPLTSSVSQLESYASCPFQFFADSVLKLKERDMAALAPVDIGQVFHAVLEDFVSAIAQQGMSFQQLEQADLLQRLGQSHDRVLPQFLGDPPHVLARDAYVLHRSRDHLETVIRSQRDVARRGITRPCAVEVPFGFEWPESLPPLRLATQAGRELILRGFIDRVDLARSGTVDLGVVIDYKRTRNKHLDLGHVYYGLALQLLAYQLVLAEVGDKLGNRPIHPIAGFYVSLVPNFNASPLDDSKPEPDGDFQSVPGSKAHRPRGVLLGEAFSALDGNYQSGQWSKAYSFFRKNDGSLGYLNSSDAAGAEEFEALLQHTRCKLTEFADGILSGQFEVRPFRLGTESPCPVCAYRNVCRYEMGRFNTRFLESLSRSEVLLRMRG